MSSFTARPWSTGNTTQVRHSRCTAMATCSATSARRAEFLPAYRRTFAKIGRERGWPAMSDAAVEELIAPDGALFFGRPETVAEKVLRLHELMNIDRFELHVSH